MQVAFLVFVSSPTQILRSPVQVKSLPEAVETAPVVIGPLVQVFEKRLAKARQSAID